MSPETPTDPHTPSYELFTSQSGSGNKFKTKGEGEGRKEMEREGRGGERNLPAWVEYAQSHTDLVVG